MEQQGFSVTVDGVAIVCDEFISHTGGHVLELVAVEGDTKRSICLIPAVKIQNMQRINVPTEEQENADG